jgi:hypothetical protein
MSAERAAQLLDAGIWLKLSGDVEGAQRLFARALKLDPQNAKAKELLMESVVLTPTALAPVILPAVAPSIASVAPSESAATNLLTSAPVMLTEEVPPPKNTMPEFLAPRKSQSATLHGWGPAAALNAPWSNDQVASPTSESSADVNGVNVLLRSSVEDSGAHKIPTQAPENTLFPEISAVVFAAPPEPMAPFPFVNVAVLAVETPADESNPMPSVDAFIEAPPPEPVVEHVESTRSGWDLRASPAIEVVGNDRAMDLLSTDSQTKTPTGEQERVENIEDLMRAARDCIDLDDHTGAMALILRAERQRPNDSAIATMKATSETKLLAILESKLLPLNRRPRILLKDDEIIWLNLDHRAGFVLAQIDGEVSFEDIFNVSGMSRMDTAKILVQLTDEGVISRN